MIVEWKSDKNGGHVKNKEVWIVNCIQINLVIAGKKFQAILTWCLQKQILKQVYNLFNFGIVQRIVIPNVSQLSSVKYLYCILEEHTKWHYPLLGTKWIHRSNRDKKYGVKHETLKRSVLFITVNKNKLFNLL